ncbi:hypothetical protein EV363DRAFT_1166209 [Boletus edulis]|nr:hypothetical protein EV363DRAFT_1166209 [Boletus edulis]
MLRTQEGGVRASNEPIGLVDSSGGVRRGADGPSEPTRSLMGRGCIRTSRRRARQCLERGPKGCECAIRANALIDGAEMHQNESSAGSSMPREGCGCAIRANALIDGAEMHQTSHSWARRHLGSGPSSGQTSSLEGDGGDDGEADGQPLGASSWLLAARLPDHTAPAHDQSEMRRFEVSIHKKSKVNQAGWKGETDLADLDSRPARFERLHLLVCPKALS